ncbi:MAG: DsbA family oxidoreductase [Dehalococcoidia bacterium]|nr:DsbA family oxidoreductase [Dehalococcoidia bacterium]
MADVRLIVFSDYICPWCYVGQARVQQLQKEFNAEVEWWPYELHPGLPAEGKPREPRPGASRTQLMAQEEGLEMVQPAIQANSKLAQEATEWARAQSKGNEFHHAVFEAYWKRGLNISLEEVILHVTCEMGMDAEALRKALREGTYRQVLEDRLDQARQAGVRAVPTYLLNEQYAIEGVYPYETFRRVVKQQIFKEPASRLQLEDRGSG